nr:FAD-dependent oxidoreductase [Methanobrevibacter arboriphilus]
MQILIFPILKALNIVSIIKIYLNSKKVPERLNILGGSIIAAEISNIYSSLGSEVNVIARSEFLKELDPEIKEYVVKKIT